MVPWELVWLVLIQNCPFVCFQPKCSTSGTSSERVRSWCYSQKCRVLGLLSWLSLWQREARLQRGDSAVQVYLDAIRWPSGLGRVALVRGWLLWRDG